MSAKNLDNHNRWRNRTVAFRVSEEENTQIDTAVKLTGLTKQDYITRRLLCKDVVVQGNPRVFKALRNQMTDILDELRRIEAGAGVDDELLDIIEMIAVIMDGMKEDTYGKLKKRPPQTHLLAQMQGSRPLKLTLKLYQTLAHKATFLRRNL